VGETNEPHGPSDDHVPVLARDALRGAGDTRANAQPAQVSVTASAPIVKAVAGEAAATSCARKVKVVYAGYGEGTARPCEAQAVAN
jgi:hypothetical protein